HRTRALLMGGQACVLYGTAEFTIDVDLVVEPNEKNLDHLRAALDELQAEPVYLPALSRDALVRGHGCHFRAHHPDRAYWAPLRAELAQWRSQRARKSATGRPQRLSAKDP
ncbi:MAG TPA: hypothetical protein VGX76_10825, partial [Pirellulales bacterium]|nr:hypothetical protein [Pirellulales bacterium]